MAQNGIGAYSGEPKPSTNLLPAKVYAGLYWFLAALAGLLILVPRNLPFHDLANHLSRYYVLTRDANLPQTKDLYHVHFGLTPNLGVDILSTVLGQIIPAEFVVKGLLFLALVAWTSGIYLLSKSRNEGRCTPLTFLAPVMFFNVSVLMGYLNFAFTASFIPLIFYAAERIETPKKRALFLVGTILLTYFGHMLACLIIVGLMFFQGLSQRRTALGRSTVITSSVMAVVVAILFKLGSVASETKQWRFTSPLNKIWLIRTCFEVGPKLFLTTTIIFAVIAALFIFRAANIKRADRSILIYFAVIFAACPFGLELVMNLDGRIVPIGLALLFALAGWKGAKTKAAELGVVGAVFLVALTALYPVYRQVHDGNAEGAKVREMVQPLEPGSLLVTVDLNIEMTSSMANWDPGVRMVSYYAMSEKPFIMPGIYMFPTQQPITVKPENPLLDFVSGEGESVSDEVQVERNIARIKDLQSRSKSLAGKPLYLLLVNHKRTGFPPAYGLHYLGQDSCVALAKLQ